MCSDYSLAGAFASFWTGPNHRRRHALTVEVLADNDVDDGVDDDDEEHNGIC